MMRGRITRFVVLFAISAASAGCATVVGPPNPGADGTASPDEASSPGHAADPSAPQASGPPGGEVRMSAEEGLLYETVDGRTRLHLGGVGALHLYEYGSDNTRDDGLAIGRAVLRLDGRFDRDWSFRIGADLHGVDTEYGLEEAWIARSRDPAFRLRAGLLEMPLGFDFSFAEEDLAYTAYGFSSYVDGRTDWGVGLDGEIAEGAFFWELMLAAGEGFDLFGETQDSPQLSARVVTYPFRPAGDWGLARGLFAGFGASYSPNFRGNFDVSTPFRNTLFRTEDLRADEARFWHFSAGWDAGPVRLSYETVLGEVFEEWFGSGSGFQGADSPAGDVDLDQVGTWEAGIAWTITGEPYDSRPFRVRETRGREGDFPADSLGSQEGGIGAVEVFYRYSNADIDRGFFDSGLASYAESSQEFRTNTVGVHWYPRRSVRLGAAIAYTLADQSPAAFEGEDRDLSFRLEVQYRL